MVFKPVTVVDELAGLLIMAIAAIAGSFVACDQVPSPSGKW